MQHADFLQMLFKLRFVVWSRRPHGKRNLVVEMVKVRILLVKCVFVSKSESMLDVCHHLSHCHMQDYACIY